MIAPHINDVLTRAGDSAACVYRLSVILQDDGYGGGQQRPPQPHPQDQQPGGGVGGGGGADGPGIWSRFKGKVFQGDANGDADEGPPRCDFALLGWVGWWWW